MSSTPAKTGSGPRTLTVKDLSRLGDARAPEVLAAAIDGGFNAWSFMAWDPWLEPLRGTAAFEATRAKAVTRYHAAVAAFTEAGGAQLLGGAELSGAAAPGAPMA